MVKDLPKINNRKSAYLCLKDYCPIMNKDDYVEITKWSNNEGYTITSSNKLSTNTINIDLTRGQLEALIDCYLYIEFGKTLNLNEE